MSLPLLGAGSSGGGVPADALLTESGAPILAESGEYLLEE